MSREMVNSGIPWMGKIPSNWRIGKVKHFYRFITGFTPDSKNESFYDENGTPWVTISDMDGKYVVGTKNGISPNYISAKNPTLVPSNSLLYSFKLSVGQVARTTFDVYTNEAIASFLPLDNISLDYLFYSSQVCIIENANENIYGAKLLNQDLINNATILFPPLEEQQKIASFLDRKCDEIDEMIALQEKIIEELKAYKQSVITEAVTKGLNPDVPMKDSGIEWIGEIPERWSLYRIKYNTFLKGRIGWQGLNSNDFIDEGYCLITGTDFDNKGGINWDTCYRISKERFDEDELLHIKNGDLLMTKDGTVGKMAYIQNLPEEASLNSHLLIIRQTTNIISNEFLYWVMLSNVFKRFCSIYQSGSIMSSISQSTLGMMSCYCPSIEEQNSIVTYLKTKCTEIDSLINIKLSKIDSLKEYKKSIIYEYVTGKKEITE